jgi:hypothetical protein
MDEIVSPKLHIIEDEVRAALKHHVFVPALALALTIPDAYGQIEYPDEKSVGKRYQQWFDKFCSFSSPIPNSDSGILGFDGVTCYKLRCELLHSGDADIDIKELSGMPGEPGRRRESDGIHTKENTSFSIRVGLSSAYGKHWVRGRESEAKYTVVIDLEQLCNALCDSAEWYKRYHIEQLGRIKEVGIHIEDFTEVSMWNPEEPTISGSL